MTVLDALVGECDAIADALDGVDEASFSRVTNCPPWTLKELVVHLWGTIQVGNAWTPTPEEPGTAADYYRRAERETTEYRTLNVVRSQRGAARYPTGAAAVTAFRRTAQEIPAKLASTDLTQAVQVANIAIRIEDFLITRVVSVAIHGVDVAISLGVPPFTTPAAGAMTVALLEDLLGTSAKELGWTDAELIVRASGREELSAKEVSRLGDLAAKFPVLS